MDRAIIEHYAHGGEKLSLAIRGLTAEDLLVAPPQSENAGLWSTHEVVLHLADAEAAFADRMRRIIAEENPPLLAWDENRFAARLHYLDQSAEDAAKLIDLTRLQLARVLRKLPDADFARQGKHSARGPQTLEAVIGDANGHLDHHLAFIHKKRQFMGKEMW